MRVPAASRRTLGLTTEEYALLRRLDTPTRIQDFLYRLQQNFESGIEKARWFVLEQLMLLLI